MHFIKLKKKKKKKKNKKKHTRLFATDYLQYLLRSGVNDFWQWGIKYLSIQVSYTTFLLKFLIYNILF